MSDQTVLDQFGQLIVRNVRDEMIVWFDQTATGIRRDIYSRYLLTRLQSLSPECLDFIKELLPTLVDGTIATFLQQFDLEDRLRIEMRTASGTFIDLNEVTEGLEAEYSFPEGWAVTFSHQRPDTFRQEAERQFNQSSKLSENETHDK